VTAKDDIQQFDIQQFDPIFLTTCRDPDLALKRKSPPPGRANNVPNGKNTSDQQVASFQKGPLKAKLHTLALIKA
jgi:hypothetical protein